MQLLEATPLGRIMMVYLVAHIRVEGRRCLQFPSSSSLRVQQVERQYLIEGTSDI